MKPVVTQTIKNKFADALELPKGIVMDYATIEIIGDEEARIFNHKGLVQYREECIRARSLQGMIEIQGRALQILSFSSQEIRILGQIHQVVLK